MLFMKCVCQLHTKTGQAFQLVEVSHDEINNPSFKAKWITITYTTPLWRDDGSEYGAKTQLFAINARPKKKKPLVYSVSFVSRTRKKLSCIQTTALIQCPDLYDKVIARLTEELNGQGQ